MSNKNVKRFLLLFALGIAYGFMYVMPYMKSSFYDQMIAAMGCTNEQLGSLMTYYTIALTISYLPGGWIGDRFNPKPVLLASIFGQAVLSFLFMFTYQSYTMSVIIWCLMALTGGFAFWPSLMKGIRMTGSDEEQGRIFGIFEALNGLASLLLSFVMLGIMAIAGAGDLVTGFKSAVASMGVLSLVSGILVLILMPKNAAYGAANAEATEKIGLKDYISTFKIPGVWIMSILVWCYVTISAVASYLTPYSTNVLGMSAVLASSIGTIRTYGCRLVGGPLGGYLADKAFKSVSKEQVLGQAACAVTLGLFLVLPTGISGGLLVVLLLLVGVAMFLCKGTYFSVQPELGIPTNVSATAVAIATLIGYLPDMFVHTMFGKWIDTYGDAGYTRIFIYGIGTAVLGIIAALLAVYISHRNAKKAGGTVA
ncbi:MAG: MFS transporter [Candidatus Scatomorpha sp.]|jgi:sugar phosphate permease